MKVEAGLNNYKGSSARKENELGGKIGNDADR
jgi:hypothetical protein